MTVLCLPVRLVLLTCAARRIVSAGSQSGSESVPASPSTRSSRHAAGMDGSRAGIAGSPMCVLGHNSSVRHKFGSPGTSTSGSSAQVARFAVSQSLDGSLLSAAGAERVLRESPVGALQQVGVGAVDLDCSSSCSNSSCVTQRKQTFVDGRM